jgi:hypothetical protein
MRISQRQGKSRKERHAEGLTSGLGGRSIVAVPKTLRMFSSVVM